MELMHTESETTAVDSNSALTHDSFLDISVSGMTIRVTEQTSSVLFKKVLGVLAHFECCNLFPLKELPVKIIILLSEGKISLSVLYERVNFNCSGVNYTV